MDKSKLSTFTRPVDVWMSRHGWIKEGLVSNVSSVNWWFGVREALRLCYRQTHQQTMPGIWLRQGFEREGVERIWPGKPFVSLCDVCMMLCCLSLEWVEELQSGVARMVSYGIAARLSVLAWVCVHACECMALCVVFQFSPNLACQARELCGSPFPKSPSCGASDL